MKYLEVNVGMLGGLQISQNTSKGTLLRVLMKEMFMGKGHSRLLPGTVQVKF